MQAKEKKERLEWKKLDNASKIFPAISDNKDTKEIGRASCRERV